MTPERVNELRTRYPSLKFVAELADEVDLLREERDTAHKSILLIAESLARLAAFQLADNPDDPAWNIVNASAQQLLAATGPLPLATDSPKDVPV